ncbi:uncharacterized protein LTR77_005238 [Saxophila tyrrhenica]|uniref:Uncharacterized protein n=1 Tax=Saxophila tyrrhenica TaxID=1690608 RepID=A0AAV9PBM8_9PEZI|nr:hypothetical protein LTR77_005238 [Saxophila tyrrhenica]
MASTVHGHRSNSQLQSSESRNAALAQGAEQLENDGAQNQGELDALRNYPQESSVERAVPPSLTQTLQEGRDGGLGLFERASSIKDSDAFGATESPPKAQSKPSDAYFESYSSLCQQEDLMKERTEDLSNLEFRLTDRFGLVLSAMRASGFADSLKAEMLDDALSVSDVVSSTTSPTGVDPMLTEYYSKQGDVGILLERLQELEYTHQEGMETRAFMAERGDNLEVVDEEFERNHQDRKQQLQLELDHARIAAAALRSQCESRGIDVNAKRRTTEPSMYTGSVAFAGGDELDSDAQSQKIRPVRYEPTGFKRTVPQHQLIGGWLDSMLSRGSFEDLQSPGLEPYFDTPGTPQSEHPALP